MRRSFTDLKRVWQNGQWDKKQAVICTDSLLSLRVHDSLSQEERTPAINGTNCKFVFYLEAEKLTIEKDKNFTKGFVAHRLSYARKIDVQRL